MARIGVLGFLHETNTFAPDVTGLDRFEEADAWPGLTEGEAILEATRDMNLAISGFISAMHSAGHEIVPLLWCSANPSGPVADAAFETIVARIETHLRDQPLDGLFLDLHGSMVTQRLDDAEGELLRRLRAITGPALPYVAALDFHAIVTRVMVDLTQAMVAYHSYPHVDMADTGVRAARMMQRLLAGESFFADWRKLDFLVSMPWQSTLGDAPASALMAEARALETADCPEVQFIPGFPLSDTPESGPSILAYARVPARATHAVQTLARAVEARRTSFSGRLYAPDEALDALTDRASGCVILADTQDNPGGGGSGDTTGLLRALLDRSAGPACVAVLCDAAFARAAHEQGVGARIDLPLGGRGYPGDEPATGPFDILALGDGRFVGTGPFYKGCRMDLGLMARVRRDGVEVLISSRKQQAADQAMFHHLGADPRHYRVLVLKSSVHFRADFAALADDILMIKAPGANTADLRDLTFRRLRPGVEIH
ncbi:MAG: M81 family metallopeptidase [Castellaniella sp.]|uniref:M81 family metallopeptidase n=1 Tax=Castellaniella sp. TaxID=1955812 RepID=UPI003A835B0A